IDEPNNLLLLAEKFAVGRNYRQSAIQLYRTIEIIPEFLIARLALGSVLVRGGFPEKALEMVNSTREICAAAIKSATDRLTLIETEALAYAAKDDLPAAEKILLEAQAKHPLRTVPYSTLVDIYRARR